MTEPLLRTQALARHFGGLAAVDGVTIDVSMGQVHAVIGPNGAGKSTLLKALAGLLPHGGAVSWNGARLGDVDARSRARALAYLPQAPVLHWPMLTRDLVALGRLPHRAYGESPTAADEDAVAWAMAETETGAFAERTADRLSSGERARVLLARALAVRAPVLLVDEPIAMLDPYHQLHIMTVLRNYTERSLEPGGPHGLVVAVLHDLALAARFCSRVLLMDGGTVVDDGEPARTLNPSAMRRHYRIEPWITAHDGEPVIVPWRRLG